jgi:hypothetical protein
LLSVALLALVILSGIGSVGAQETNGSAATTSSVSSPPLGQVILAVGAAVVGCLVVIARLVDSPRE